ncbi:CBS domain-containing protein [Halomonas ramblicola]|uniref:CBS domain-containing protein n=1 Tax=Halomonas ramblicola TaxID=747349 RepID=UPI0025B60D3E|nr:CBS domain-containing protein [Halomonas ramblicola]MDN3520122.1 CBS domain-containing protein [Halomonas ramblicola]
MQAADIMTRNVITVTPDSEVREIASLLLEHGISAVPVVDEAGKILGIVSEGDLIRRVEDDKRSKSWWLKLFEAGNPAEYVRSHGRRAHEIMTRDPITVGEDRPVHEIARLLEKHHIKRVPVVEAGKLVGIVSRSNLLRGFSVAAPEASVTADDREIREAILKEVDENTGVLVDRINVIVTQGKVQLWGLVESEEERMAVQVAAENTPGVGEVENNLGYVPRGVGTL